MLSGCQLYPLATSCRGLCQSGAERDQAKVKVGEESMELRAGSRGQELWGVRRMGLQLELVRWAAHRMDPEGLEGLGPGPGRQALGMCCGRAASFKGTSRRLS